MKIFISNTNDPYENIACEEYLIKHSTNEVLFLYRNLPSVIVGKHQNAFSEINPIVVRENDIKVVRRLSGGGAVYHDLGNLNYAHIKSVDGDNKVDFTLFLTPLMEALKNFGVDTEIGPRNNLLLNGKKITGTACHTIKHRVMHHGTLLFNADLKRLTEVLLPKNGTFESKAVKSVSSSVTNITDHLKDDKTMGDLIDHLYHFFISQGADPLQLSLEDEASIHNLIKTKYSLWEWNYAYSPKFTFNWKDKLKIHIVKGVIKNIEPFDPLLEIEPVYQELIDKRFYSENFI